MKAGSVELLNECFNYFPDTGVITWKDRPLSHFSSVAYHGRWLKRFAGKEAGTVRALSNGYSCRVIGYSGYTELAHRIALRMSGFEIPEGMVVDHINRNALDNRLENLRIVTTQENLKNSRRGKNNSTGHTGVYRHRGKRWLAIIGVNGKLKYLGVFDRLEDAIACRIAAEKQYGYTKQHGK